MALYQCLLLEIISSLKLHVLATSFIPCSYMTCVGIAISYLLLYSHMISYF